MLALYAEDVANARGGGPAGGARDGVLLIDAVDAVDDVGGVEVIASDLLL